MHFTADFRVLFNDMLFNHNICKHQGTGGFKGPGPLQMKSAEFLCQEQQLAWDDVTNKRTIRKMCILCHVRVAYIYTVNVFDK
jgi:hypothetical protein